MDMQREDFLKICTKPELTFVADTVLGKRVLRTRDGIGASNVIRVITDWFPEGRIVQVQGSAFISRGAVRSESHFLRPELQLLSPKDFSVKKLSVFEALGLAEICNKEESK